MCQKKKSYKEKRTCHFEDTGMAEWVRGLCKLECIDRYLPTSLKNYDLFCRSLFVASLT